MPRFWPIKKNVAIIVYTLKDGKKHIEVCPYLSQINLASRGMPCPTSRDPSRPTRALGVFTFKPVINGGKTNAQQSQKEQLWVFVPPKCQRETNAKWYLQRPKMRGNTVRLIFSEIFRIVLKKSILQSTIISWNQGKSTKSAERRYTNPMPQKSKMENVRQIQK